MSCIPSLCGEVAGDLLGAARRNFGGNCVLNQPDRIVFDLDPDEDLRSTAVRRVAFNLRDRLADLSLPSAPLLSGGKGIHVIVPPRPEADWEKVKLISRTLAILLETSEPDRFIATTSKAKRKGLIFID